MVFDDVNRKLDPVYGEVDTIITTFGPLLSKIYPIFVSRSMADNGMWVLVMSKERLTLFIWSGT